MASREAWAAQAGGVIRNAKRRPVLAMDGAPRIDQLRGRITPYNSQRKRKRQRSFAGSIAIAEFKERRSGYLTISTLLWGRRS
jgi:hypothetical protein